MRGRRLACCTLAALLAACVQRSTAAERPTAREGAVPPAAATQLASFEAPQAPSRAPEFEPPPAFFEQVIAEARALASQPAAPAAEMVLPPALRHLSYDAYRKIRFRPERSLWRGEPGRFEIQFLHAGGGYLRPVAISVIEGGSATQRGSEHAIPFTTEWFSYEGLPAPPPAQGLGFTGLRVHAPLNRADYRDEVLVFQGASYFRALAKGDVYGISARALAIDLGESRPEEFPSFTHFYLLRPGAEDEALWILALLDSKRASGAYAFHVRPGATTLIDVSAALFVREPIAALGLAPLSSMFLFGEEGPNRFGDFRPEVHDSDGLSFWGSTGEWLFRPLRNPSRTVASTFRMDAPHGFGLLQRDRTFDHYQDLEARYQDRPSIWVEPIAGFERGSLRLLEIAASAETGDNVATAWLPEGGAAKGQNFDFRYRLRVGSRVSPGPAGWVSGTRIGRTEHGARFLVDFVGHALGDAAAVEAVVSSTGGRVLEQHLEQNTLADGLRASFEVSPEGRSQEVELRAFLRARGSKATVLTETWSYLWQPN